MDLNRAIVVGRVTKDIELKTTPSGQSVASFGVATNRRWTDKQGQKQESTEFHNVVLWGRTAEVAAQFLVKGSECMIEGRLQTRKWEDKQGGTRYATEIVGESLSLGSRPQGAKQGAAAAEAKGEELPTVSFEEEPQGGEGIDVGGIKF